VITHHAERAPFFLSVFFFLMRGKRKKEESLREIDHRYQGQIDPCIDLQILRSIPRVAKLFVIISTLFFNMNIGLFAAAFAKSLFVPLSFVGVRSFLDEHYSDPQCGKAPF
jgi:hypothetical protein